VKIRVQWKIDHWVERKPNRSVTVGGMVEAALKIPAGGVHGSFFSESGRQQAVLKEMLPSFDVN
jgi:hypothetical protein